MSNLLRLCKRTRKLAEGARCDPSSEEFAKAIDGIADQVIQEFGLDIAIDESKYKEFIKQQAINAFRKPSDNALAERADQ